MMSCYSVCISHLLLAYLKSKKENRNHVSSCYHLAFCKPSEAYSFLLSSSACCCQLEQLPESSQLGRISIGFWRHRLFFSGRYFDKFQTCWTLSDTKRGDNAAQCLTHTVSTPSCIIRFNCLVCLKNAKYSILIQWCVKCFKTYVDLNVFIGLDLPLLMKQNVKFWGRPMSTMLFV